ncbi:MAG: ribbon-helix-helix domain-containing protein [Pseudomonadota bacterium]
MTAPPGAGGDAGPGTPTTVAPVSGDPGTAQHAAHRAALQAAIDARPLKRSVTLLGHRTSVSLEEAFWSRFVALARARGVSVNALAAEIDAQRDPAVTLAGSIRVYVLARSAG